jgi:hypothetical protein
MGFREELKKLLSEDPHTVEHLRSEIAVEKERTAKELRFQQLKEQHERERLDREALIKNECDKPILEFSVNCQNCNEEMKIGPQIGFVRAPRHIHSRIRCAACGKVNWILLNPLGVKDPAQPIAYGFGDYEEQFAQKSVLNR